MKNYGSILSIAVLFLVLAVFVFIVDTPSSGAAAPNTSTPPAAPTQVLLSTAPAPTQPPAPPTHVPTVNPPTPVPPTPVPPTPVVPTNTPAAPPTNTPVAPPTNTPVSPPPGPTPTVTLASRPPSGPTATATTAAVRIAVVATPSCVINTATMADGTRDFVRVCPGDNLSVGKWVLTGDSKFANAATFIPGACGNFIFYIGIWNKNEMESVVALPLSTTAKFPMSDTFSTDFKIKNTQVVGSSAAITYTLSATNTLVVNILNTDLRPYGQSISSFDKNIHYLSFAGVVVTTEFCR